MPVPPEPNTGAGLWSFWTEKRAANEEFGVNKVCLHVLLLYREV